MAENQRAKALTEIDVFAAGNGSHRSTLGALKEKWRAADAFESAHRTMHAAGRDARRALEILADAGRYGVSDATLLAYGFWHEMLSELVLAGLATVATETIGPVIEVERYRITDDGRKALKG